MKKNYFLLALLCLLSVSQIFGQVRHITSALRIKKHIYHSISAKPVTDTIMPASFSGSCLDSLKLYYADQAPHDSGWICGTNGWLDKEKAEKFFLGSASVNAVIPFFGIRKGTNGTIYAKLYARDPTSKGPGTLLGTSNGIAMSAIDTFHQGINFRNVFHFSPAINVTDTFFVSLTFPVFVNNVTELGLISESIGCSTPYRYNAWEQWNDNTWHSFYAAYGVNIDMAMFPVISVPSTQNDILTFYLAQQTSPATINPSLHQVFIQVAHGTDITSLSPTITTSAYSTINPLSNTPQNFTNPFTYNVTAENGSVQPWVVNVSVAPQLSSENDILTFTLSQLTSTAVINNVTHTVTGQVAHGTSLLNLAPTITVSPNATINPASGSAHNFTNPFAYTVTAQDGTPQNWIVTITEASALRSGKNIVSFTLSQQESPATIDTNTHYVSVTVVYGTDRSSLIPAITVSPGATINPASGVSLNFTNPVAYTVTAENGITQPWVVNVSVAAQPSAQNDILTFTLSQLTLPAVIDNSSHTVTGQVIHGTGLTSLTPVITVSPMATINPASGTAQNFTNPVAYTVTAQNGTPQNWIITLTEASVLRSGKNILTFSLPQQESPANIDTNTHYVSISVVHGTGLTSLTPVITVSPGATINPASGTTHNFTNPFAYTVTAEDHTSQNWVVSVTESVGFNDLSQLLPVNVFPNPATGFIYIESPDVNVGYKLYDICGSILREGFTAMKRQLVDISGIDQGVYFIKFSKGNKNSIKKMVIQ